MKSVQHSDLKRVKQIAMNGYYSVLTTIDLFVLSFMGLLTRLSESLNKKQKRGFFLAFALIAGISVMEIVTLAVDGAPAKYRWLNIASNFLGFGLSPAVAICLVYVQDRKSAPRQNLRFAVVCEIAYLLFLAFSIPFGTVFSVSADNVYSRGTHFHIYIAVYFAAIFYLSLATILTARAFQNRSRALIYPLIVFLTAETIVQVALPDLHVTWLCVTLLAVLYYIYCTEMWNQLDALTGLLNQSSYLHRTAEMTRRGGMLVVFDVDHFKHINDRYGHLQGDVCLAEIADCIKKAYASYGYCYRIGGDEFCVLLKDAQREAACGAWRNGGRQSPSCPRSPLAPLRFRERTWRRSRSRRTAECIATKKGAEPAFASAEVCHASKPCSRGRFYAISHTLKESLKTDVFRLSWRRVRDSNPRSLSGSQHFECCTFDHSDNSPRRDSLFPDTCLL